MEPKSCHSELQEGSKSESKAAARKSNQEETRHKEDEEDKRSEQQDAIAREIICCTRKCPSFASTDVRGWSVARNFEATPIDDVE